jgi:hypothetical protein
VLGEHCHRRDDGKDDDGAGEVNPLGLDLQTLTIISALDEHTPPMPPHPRKQSRGKRESQTLMQLRASLTRHQRPSFSQKTLPDRLVQAQVGMNQAKATVGNMLKRGSTFVGGAGRAAALGGKKTTGARRRKTRKMSIARKKMVELSESESECDSSDSDASDFEQARGGGASSEGKRRPRRKSGPTSAVIANSTTRI